MSSRSSSTSTPTAPATANTTNGMTVPHDKVAMRAYDKWCKRGCPMGSEKQDWLEAEAELRIELSRMAGAGATTARR